MRRQGIAWALIAVLIIAAAAPALATGGGESFEGYLTPGTFSIDGAFRSEEMNAPYSEGYDPEIADGILEVVLPLQASRPVDGNVIYCDLNLGSAAESPFLYKNYDSIPVHMYESDPSLPTETENLYVASFSLPLKEDRQNGVYPLGVTIRYRVQGQEASQFFNIDFSVEDAAELPSDIDVGPGDEPEGPGGPGTDMSGGGYEPAPEPEIPSGGGVEPAPGGAGAGAEGSVSEPKVILEQAVAAPSPCDAGGTFTVTCTLRNTSEKDTVRNLTATYKSQTPDLIPNSGSSTSYIESIRPNATAQFAFSMRAVEAAASGPQKIDIALAYEGKDGTPYQASDEVTVLIQQKIRLEHDEPVFPTNVFLGDTINATLNLYNKGKGTLYNVTVALDVPGITPESSAFLGNMESGSSKSADIYASVTGLDVDDAGQEGNPNGAGNVVDFQASARMAAPAGGADSTGVMLSDASDWAAPAGYDPYGTGTAAGAGMTSGNFIITYEDEFGTGYEELVPVETQIESVEALEPPPDMDPSDIEPEPEGMPWWGWAAIAGGGGAAAAVLGVRAKKKKRARELVEESAEDDDLY